MAKFIGRQVDLGLAREVTRGTAVVPTYWVPKTSFSVEDKIVKVRSEAGVGSLADSEESFITTRHSQGQVAGEIRDKSFGLFLYAMLGSLSTTGPTDSAYTHAFSLQDSTQHQSLSLTVVDDINTELYKLVMLDSLEITAELDQIVKYTATFLGKKGNLWTAQTPSYSAENKFTKKHVSFKVASSLAGLDAASAISLKSVRLTISKNVAMDDVLGTAEPEDILNKSIGVEGEITLNYEDTTWKDYFTGNTNRAVELKFVNTDATIGSSTNPSLTIRLPKVDFFEWEPDYSTDGIVTQTLSLKGSQDVSGSNDIISTCELVNAVTSY